MKRYVVYIGPETFIFRATSKAHLVRRIRRWMKPSGRLWRDDSLCIRIPNGRWVSPRELREAEVISVGSYLKSIEDYTKFKNQC